MQHEINFNSASQGCTLQSMLELIRRRASLLLGTADVEIKVISSSLLRAQNWQIISLSKAGVGQNIAEHASPTATNSFHVCFIPSRYVHRLFPKIISIFANAVTRVGWRNKLGHPVYSHKRFKQVAHGECLWNVNGYQSM